MSTWKVPHVYLPIQYNPEDALAKDILREITEELRLGRYTLGPQVERFEQRFAEVHGVKHAIGVNSGTDALILIMAAMGIGHNDIVITAPNTFIATAGAIVANGAIPAFVDVRSDYQMDFERLLDIRGSVLPKMVIPVHYTGQPATPTFYAPVQGKMTPDYKDFLRIPAIEDACQAVGASAYNRPVGGMGIAAAFSLHPLKNVNVWGDGGVVTTNNESLAKEIRLLRNHGLQDRDTCVRPGVNSRLDTIQAIVGWHALKALPDITAIRREHAKRYDAGLKEVRSIMLPPRDINVKHVYHLYVIMAERRDELKKFLREERGIEALIHYPIPIHLQPGYKELGYKKGDFPNAEWQAEHILTLPIHQYLSNDQIDYTIEAVAQFYEKP